jgi:hypothetical protein
LDDWQSTCWKFSHVSIGVPKLANLMAALLDSNVGSSILNWKKTGKARNEKKRTCMRRTQPEVGILV